VTGPMNDSTPTPIVRAAPVLGVALLLGLLADYLFRSAGEPTVAFFLWPLVLAVAVVMLRRRTGTLSTEAAVLLGLGLLSAAVHIWRDAPALRLLAFWATAAAFALAAFHGGAAWIRRSGVVRYAASVAGTALHTAFGPFLTLGDVDWSSIRGESAPASRWRRAAPVARGLLLAVPLLVVFGGLFASADPVFAAMLDDLARIDPEQVAGHVLLTGFFAWIATGYARGFLTGTAVPLPPAVTRLRPWLGITEVGVVLGLLSALFAAFVAVQFRYLFGGGTLVEVTPGLTYAEYARRGFFELVAVAALTLPVLLAADWLLRRERPRDERIFRVLAGAQIVLLAAVMTSAFTRMRLYLEAYGLTEQRFYATSFLAWLAFVLAWLAVTILRGRREQFAFGALVSAFVLLAALVLVNPDARIARTNLARAAVSPDALEAFDASYAASLSADAVPVLVPALPDLHPAARCQIARRVLRRWGPEQERDWRSWSVSTARARAVVRAHEAELRSALGPDGGCRATSPGA